MARSVVRHPAGRLRALLLVLMLVGAALAALADINPGPIAPEKLYRYADRILRVELGSPVAGRPLSVTVVEVIKGDERALPPLTLHDADAGLVPELRAAFRGRTTASGLLFMTERWLDEDLAMMAGEALRSGSLAVDTAWFDLAGTAGGLRVSRASHLWHAVTWNGGDRTLADCMRGIRRTLVPAVGYGPISTADYSATPTCIGAEWDQCRNLGTMAGRVSGMQVLDVLGTGRNALFVASPDGDRLYARDAAGTLEDVTAKVQLTSRSVRFAWLDVNADGRLDLASSDGVEMRIHYARKDGAFDATAFTYTHRAPCAGLVPMAAGADAGVLIAVPNPVLAMPETLGDRRLPADPRPLAEPGPCVATDFDGDGLADVVQVGRNGARFYKRIGETGFDPPAVACAADLGAGITGASLGDFDHDGRIDVLVTGKVGASLLINMGDGRFEDMFRYAGDMATSSKPNMTGSAVCDLNNDGRQDVACFYADRAVQVFFNRGYRCFGRADDMDMGAVRACAAALEDGQQAGAVGDLNGDGAEDLAAVGLGGDVCVLYRSANRHYYPDMASKYGLTVALPTGQIGPVQVAAHLGQRCLGARVATSGSPAFFGLPAKSALHLTWRTGDGEHRRTVPEAQSRFALPADPG